MTNKKGLSEVVTTVILILVVLAAVVIIWSFVRPTIQGTSEQITTDCFSVSLEATQCNVLISNQSQGVCSNNATRQCTNSAQCTNGQSFGNCLFSNINVTEVKVKRNAGGAQLAGVALIFGSGEVIQNMTSIDELETLTFRINADHRGDTVDVAALVGETARACNPANAPKTCS